MRNDARMDRKQTYCPNTYPTMGYDKYKAQFGDCILYKEHLENGEYNVRLARVAGRVDYAPAICDDTSPIYDNVLVMAMSDTLTFVMERWIAPEDIIRVWDPNHKDRNIEQLIQFFFSPAFKQESIETLRQWSASGYSTPDKMRDAQAKYAQEYESER